MTPTQLAEIEARLRAATPGPGKLAGEALFISVQPFGFGRICETDQSVNDAKFIANAPTDIAALIAEIARLRAALKQACDCTTCLGVGTIEVVTGYKDNGPNDPEEIYEHDECPECSGEKVGVHVTEATARVLESCR